MTIQSDPVVPANRRLLPMFAHTRGKRSPVTCHLKCADACSHPVPNTSDNDYFRDVASAALNRRKALGLAGAGALTLVAGPAVLGGSAAAAAEPTPAAAPQAAAAVPQAALADRGGNGGRGKGKLPFTPIAPVPADVDAFTVPEGYRWQALIRWGDPILPGGEQLDPENQTAAKQALQFGYNADYTDIITTDKAGRKAMLVCNHEYVNPGIMFPPSLDQLERYRIAMAAHGLSVVELERRRLQEPWSYIPTGRKNRRITVNTEFELVGPAAGHDLLKTEADPTGTSVYGTLGNCAGGTTPWGTIISGEENFNGYFRSPVTPEGSRYGIGDGQTSYGFDKVDPRFDGVANPGYANEVNRFGYIVEIDPTDPASTPRKLTALGRFKHEGANVIVADNGHVVAYMGDDERFDYVYKFVSKNTFRTGKSAADRAHNLDLLTEGDLYVAKFVGDSNPVHIDGSGNLPADGEFDGFGHWIPLVKDGESWVAGFTVAEVLIHTRLAADTVNPTKMDRPEDVEPSLKSGKVYIACTNNTDRGKEGKTEAATEPNPRNLNRDGHVVEITEDNDDNTGRTFTWKLLLVCGDPAADNTYFGGFPKDKVSPISCPDNVAFDSEGNLWISTDGQPGTLGLCDALFKVPVTGKDRGHVQQFLAVPKEAETCGPVIHDQDGMVFVAVQHPGEDGSWDDQHSAFPDYVAPGEQAEQGQFAGPRPSIVQVYRKR